MNQHKKQIRVFGYGLPLILLILGARHWHQHGLDAIVGVFLVLAVIVLGITLFNRPWLKIIFRYWMKAAQAIGGAVTMIILTVLFYLVFGTVGIILRLLRKDLLGMNLEAPSYWIKRLKTQEDRARYTQQF